MSSIASGEGKGASAHTTRARFWCGSFCVDSALSPCALAVVSVLRFAILEMCSCSVSFGLLRVC